MGKQKWAIRCLICSVAFLAATGPIDFAYATINVREYGAAGDGSDATGAIQSAIDTAGAGGSTVYIPAGTYTISASLLIENKTYLQILGDGKGVTNLAPGPEMGGSPMIHFIGGNRCTVQGLSIQGANRAGTAIESDSAPPPEGESTGLTIRDVAINNVVDGIRFGVLDSYDSNNEMGFFENVSITNFQNTAYSFLGRNSECHTIIGGTINYGPTAVYTTGGSFKIIGTNVGASGVLFDIENPPIVGPYRANAYYHPIVITDISIESSCALLRTGNANVHILMNGIDYRFADNKWQNPVIAIDFESQGGSLALSSSVFDLGTNAKIFLNGGKSQAVLLSTNLISVNSLETNGPVRSVANCWHKTSGKSGTLLVSNGGRVIEANDQCPLSRK